MAQDDSPNPVTAEDKKAELDFRYYQAKLGVVKLVLGTVIVGLAGIIFPFFIQLYNANLSEQSAHQQYIKDFFSTAINQDIELRIRFASYFAKLAGPGQEDLWNNYLADLSAQRKEARVKINDLEGQRVDFEKLRKAKKDYDNAKYDSVVRELTWAYTEIGYVPIERSEVATPAADGAVSATNAKKMLYEETVGIIQKLVASQAPIDQTSADLARFWELYRKDLMGVESGEFARIMIQIGGVLDKLVADRAPPNDELKRLADNLLAQSLRELVAGELVAAQQQQQYQAQQQVLRIQKQQQQLQRQILQQLE